MTDHHDREGAYAELARLAEWSSWADFMEVWSQAPLTPGVYLFRLPDTGEIIYVGMAGERAGGAESARGVRGRLGVYAKGRGAVSGFGEAALDRALSDETWLREQLADLRENGSKRAKVWAQDAIAFLSPEVKWATCPDKTSARALEARVENLLGPHGLWNRASQSRRAATAGREVSPTVPSPEAVVIDSNDARVFSHKGFDIDLDVLFRRMHDLSRDEDGEQVYNGNRRDTPGIKRLLNELFGVPVLDRMHPVNHAIRSECRDRLRELGWATKDPGRSGRYVLHRQV